MRYYILIIILLFSLFVLNILVYTKRKKFEKAHSLIHLFIFLSLVNEILLRLSAFIFRNSTLVFNSFAFIEFTILFLFYYNFIGNSKNKFLFWGLMFAFLTLFSSELIYKSAFVLFNFSFLFTNVTMVILATISFRNIVRNSPTLIITDYSYFWINSGILIYYSCTLFIFGLERYTINYPFFSVVITYILHFFILIYYSLLSIGLWKTSKK